MKVMNMAEIKRRLELLDTRVQLHLSLDELRLILNCLRAVEYQMQLDDEPYLDAQGFRLKGRLEEKYRAHLKRLGIVRV